MAVFLTGDIHQSMGTGEQQLYAENEMACALTYAQIAAEHGLKVTLFVTALSVLEFSAEFAELNAMENVEIGEHGWDALRPRWWHRTLRYTFNSAHGPAFLQRQMIAKTCALLANHSGGPIRSWRNHAYRHDRHTAALLARAGIQVWSDKVDPSAAQLARTASGMTVLPINTTPDHENMVHGIRTPERIASRGKPPSLEPAAWRAKVVGQVESLHQMGGQATILAHPLCMRVAENWEIFSGLCVDIASYQSLFVSEAIALEQRT